jgi:hypothetical protein
MAGAAQHAALGAKWRVALQTLQSIPGAVADKHLSKNDLHNLVSQAEVDCSCAEYNTSLGAPIHLQHELQLQPMFGLIVNQLKVCAETVCPHRYDLV